MGDKTGISWTDSTWNCLRGCSRTIAEGAQQSGCGDPSGGGCYAERNGYRFAGPGLPYEGLVRMTPNGPRWTGKVLLVNDKLLDPVRWSRARRIFTTSVSDPFHEKLSNEAIAIMYGVMAATRRHTHQVLTKRVKRMVEWFAWVKGAASLCNRGKGMSPAAFCLCLLQKHVDSDARGEFSDADRKLLSSGTVVDDALSAPWPLPNVWQGISVENQHAYMERMPLLASLEDVAVRFLSLEPLIGEVDLDPTVCDMCGQWEDVHVEEIPGSEYCTQPTCIECDHEMGGTGWLDQLDWAIVGCESGPGARPCEVDWLRSLRDQLARAGVPMFLKQAVETQAITAGAGSKAKGRNGELIDLPYLDGVQHAAFPEATA